VSPSFDDFLDRKSIRTERHDKPSFCSPSACLEIRRPEEALTVLGDQFLGLGRKQRKLKSWDRFFELGAGRMQPKLFKKILNDCRRQ